MIINICDLHVGKGFYDKFEKVRKEPIECNNENIKVLYYDNNYFLLNGNHRVSRKILSKKDIISADLSMISATRALKRIYDFYHKIKYADIVSTGKTPLS